MKIDDLERLNALVKKGIITQEEFEIQKEKILEGGITINLTKWIKEAFGIISLIAVCVGIYYSFQGMNFACDKSFMKQAQDLINENFPNWNGALKLSNPTKVEETENSLLCKVNSNLEQIPVLHYRLDKQKDGSILISANPIAEVFANSFKEYENTDENSLEENFQDTFGDI